MYYARPNRASFEASRLSRTLAMRGDPGPADGLNTYVEHAGSLAAEFGVEIGVGDGDELLGTLPE